MIKFTEDQMVEVVLVAAKRGYRQASDDAEKRSSRLAGKYAREGAEVYRKKALAMLRERLGELKELKANDLLIAGFNEAIEHLEFGIDADGSETAGETP